MSATKLSKSESTTCESNMPRLNVPVMINPILENYNSHVNQFITLLKQKLNSHLIYEGPNNIRKHILKKSTYACSVYYRPKKIISYIFPIMIGSQLDFAIRHKGILSFEESLKPEQKEPPFQEVDIVRGFFIINGYVRHVPYFFTNNSTNTHFFKNYKMRVYSYNEFDRGKELSYYISSIKEKDKSRHYGQVVINHNDGLESEDDPNFFTHCPYPVNLTAYMKYVHRQNQFDIDHLGNKIFISPGHLFTKLFVKYLYGPLCDEKNWKNIKSKLKIVYDSIKTGNLLHVLSRKTSFYKEGVSPGKMTKEPQESHREVGANGEIFIEKTTGCYREVSTQTYPLNPFLLYLAVRQMSNKVKYCKPYHSSHEGWFCKLGIFDTKNVGRTVTLVRDVIVSSCYELDPVYNNEDNSIFWQVLNLEPDACSAKYFVVVNEACIPVTKRCFDTIQPLHIKRKFKFIECFIRDNFVVIRYKVGMIMKRLPETDIYVTPYDEIYWARLCYQINDKMELVERFSSSYSYFADLNPFFNHNSFHKNVLGLNNLKNAVLATTNKYALYFADTIATYMHAPSDSHKAVMEPMPDGVSEHFVLYLPHVTVTYMSFMGITQEDCIAKRKDFRGFDSFRFYSLRFNIKRVTSWLKFYPVYGDVDPESDLLGTLISGNVFETEPCSIHIKLVKISGCEYHLHFNKYPFKLLQYFLEEGETEGEYILTVCLEQEHRNSTSDKLCSLHGQKGVLREVDNVPLLDGHVRPDLIVNAYCMFRTTVGQILEAVIRGGGRDAVTVHNSDGKLMVGVKAFYGKTFYIPVVFFGNEHMYAPLIWILDKLTGTPVKGRSRRGGMKIGQMELNTFRGNGIAFCFELKFFQDGDRVPVEGKPTETIPQALLPFMHDTCMIKCLVSIKTTPAITTVEEWLGILNDPQVFQNIYESFTAFVDNLEPAVG